MASKPVSPEKVSLCSTSSGSLSLQSSQSEIIENSLGGTPLSSSSECIPRSLDGPNNVNMANVGVPTEEDLSLNFTPSEPFHLWKKVSSCEEFVGTRRSKHTIVAWNDRIYVFGGDNGRRMLNDFLVSHIRDSSWARVVFTGKK